MKEIPLTQGKVALVDDEDYERVVAIKWCADLLNGHWYAHNRLIGFLHRFILDAPKGIMVDHENGDGLDCQRRNMRLATNAQNQFNARKRVNNTSGYMGVSAYGDKWTARLTVQGVPVFLGCFTSREDAARAYDAKVRETRGEFGRTNFND